MLSEIMNLTERYRSLTDESISSSKNFELAMDAYELRISNLESEHRKARGDGNEFDPTLRTRMTTTTTTTMMPTKQERGVGTAGMLNDDFGFGTRGGVSSSSSSDRRGRGENKNASSSSSSLLIDSESIIVQNLKNSLEEMMIRFNSIKEKSEKDSIGTNIKLKKKGDDIMKLRDEVRVLTNETDDARRRAAEYPEYFRKRLRAKEDELKEITKRSTLTSMSMMQGSQDDEDGTAAALAELLNNKREQEESEKLTEKIDRLKVRMASTAPTDTAAATRRRMGEPYYAEEEQIQELERRLRYAESSLKERDRTIVDVRDELCRTKEDISEALELLSKLLLESRSKSSNANDAVLAAERRDYEDDYYGNKDKNEMAVSKLWEETERIRFLLVRDSELLREDSMKAKGVASRVVNDDRIGVRGEAATAAAGQEWDNESRYDPVDDRGNKEATGVKNKSYEDDGKNDVEVVASSSSMTMTEEEEEPGGGSSREISSRAIFAGYCSTKEERHRLQSAHPNPER